MIAVDTSALMAIVFNEPEAEACISAPEAEESVLISAGTLAEVRIVASRRNVAEELSNLIEGLGFEIVSVTQRGASHRRTNNGGKAHTRLG